MTIASLSILGFGLVGGLFVFLLLAAIFVFEVVMLVHVIRNTRIVSDRKLLWVVGMLLIHPFVAVAYYFTDYRSA